MSKVEKIFSIGLSMLNALQPIEDDRQYSAKVLEETLNEVKHCVKQDKVEISQKGFFEMQVVSDQGEPLLAQVKLFLYTPEIDKGTDYVEECVKKLYREVTSEAGHLDLNLEPGYYHIEVSKGSEYSIAAHDVQLIEQAKHEMQFVLYQNPLVAQKNYYAGDLHHHSIYSSPVYGGTDPVTETPDEVGQSMKAMGLKFGALSDHHNILNHEVWQKQASDEFVPIIAKEISTSNGHVQALGVKRDVIYDIPEESRRTESVLREEFLKVTSEIKALGGLAQLNHPRETSTSIAWNMHFNDMIQIFETIEIWNGANPMFYGTINADAAQLWVELLEQGRYIPCTAGSDTHNIKMTDSLEVLEELEELKASLLILPKQSPLWQARQGELETCHRLINCLLPVLKKWIHRNLSSGGVRNYVHVEQVFTAENILQSLREGKNFLTNGPVLIPSIGGKQPGERVEGIDRKKVRVDFTINSNQPLKYLTIYGNQGFTKKLLLTEKKIEAVKGFWDYSFSRELELEESCKWLFFIVDSGFMNMAITNPIFID